MNRTFIAAASSSHTDVLLEGAGCDVQLTCIVIGGAIAATHRTEGQPRARWALTPILLAAGTPYTHGGTTLLCAHSGEITQT